MPADLVFCVVMVPPVAFKVTDPAPPPSPPEPPTATETTAPVEVASPALPPPPPIDWATIPCATAPVVAMLPDVVTLVAPP